MSILRREKNYFIDFNFFIDYLINVFSIYSSFQDLYFCLYNSSFYTLLGNYAFPLGFKIISV